MPRDQQIILIEASPPIRTKKIFYYKDKFFTKRLIEKIALPTKAAVAIKRPKPRAKPEDDVDPGNSSDEVKAIEDSSTNSAASQN